jgi:hypothetical protein
MTIPFRLSLVMSLSFLYSTLYSSISYAGGEHQRRFSVEIAIAAGDSRLLSNGSLSPGKHQWIQQRVTAAINILPLLARYFHQERGIQDQQLDEKLKQLSLFADNPQKLYPQLIKLSRQYPINFPLIVPQKLDSLSLKNTTNLYNSLCLGCHLGVESDNSVVSGKLSSFAKTMDPDEWLARLLAGLHGDTYTRLENPFSDQQIAMLFSYTRVYLAD